MSEACPNRLDGTCPPLGDIPLTGLEPADQIKLLQHCVRILDNGECPGMAEEPSPEHMLMAEALGDYDPADIPTVIRCQNTRADEVIALIRHASQQN